jgi:hypothetical protein
MNGYTMEFFAEARKQAQLDEAERRRLLLAIALEPGDGGWLARWLIAPVQHVRRPLVLRRGGVAIPATRPAVE